ncbi:MAG: DEAD/DEAH box helicase [Sporomusaceae bacterium]|nr:DEAD/DEAH box helicase [Sporomusaceae bacterium]
MKHSTESGFFGGIQLSRKILAAITEMGFEEPSPIQTQTIPLVAAGRDVLGQAQTGTGKTAAFGIPIMEKLNPDSRQVQALVLTPTRELANQVAEELAKIGKFRRIKALPVYGGQPIDRQIRALKFGVQVVIGTPGRLLDHIRRGTIKLGHVQTLVLDEADEMLDMGFIDDIEDILKSVPGERQTLLFSATMPLPIKSLANRYMRSPVEVSVSRENITVPLIDQFYYETRDRLDGLCRVLETETNARAIVFCRTKKGVDELSSSLQARGFMADGLHGDLTQSQRDRVMKKFRDNQLEILVATDVAARGLDIEHVSHVINYDIPQDPESYVHRIGRTGRAGRKGVAITFIEPREFRQLKEIEKLTKTRIIRNQLPSSADILDRQREALKGRLVYVMEQGNYTAYHDVVADLAADYDGLDIAAAALKLLLEGFREKNDERPSFADTGGKKGMVRLFVNIGRAQKIRPEDIVRTFAEEADLTGNVIGAIDIYDKFTFVEVPADMAERVVAAMHKNTIKGYKINVEPAKAR